MREPEPHECALYRKILESMKGSGKTESSYYQLVEEAVRLCEMREEDGR